MKRYLLFLTSIIFIFSGAVRADNVYFDWPIPAGSYDPYSLMTRIQNPTGTATNPSLLLINGGKSTPIQKDAELILIIINIWILTITIVS